jgi:hypothetical protein
MIEIATAVSLASSAYGAIKKAMETGQEVEDMIGYFGKFFDAKDQLSEANMKASTSSFVGKMFNSGSVESQALEVTAARHKIMAIEKELREFLIYTGQIEFYEDMMKERRAIRLARAEAAKAAAERKAFWIDVSAVVGALAVVAGILVGFISIIAR